MSDLKEFRYLGNHAESLDGGRMVGTGDFTGPIDVSDESPKNQQLLRDGLLCEVPNGTHDEHNPVDDSDPELSNEAQLTEPEEQPSPDNPVIPETNVVSSPPVAPETTSNEEGDES